MVRAGAAVALAVGVLLPASMLGTSSQAAAADPVTFTVGITNEVDSFNPFNGIEGESYEMWALMYDYLIGYSMKDMSPDTRARGELGDLRRRADLDLPHPRRREVVRRRAAHGRGHRLHLRTASSTAAPRRRPGRRTSRASPRSTAPDPQTLVLTLKKPNAVLPLLPIPIVPEHIWKDVPEDEVKSFANEPKDGEPVVGSGPFRLVEGTAGGSTYRFERNPDYWNGAPHVDEVDFRVYKSEDPAVQALIKGEIDFVDEISRAPDQVACRGRTASPRRTATRRASTRSPSTPGRSTSTPASRSATPTRRCWTRSSASP